MSVLQMFRKGEIKVNQFLRAKRTMVAFGHDLFVKGRPYKIVEVNANKMVLKGEAKNTWIFHAKPGAINLFPWGNFKLIGKKAKTAG